MFVLHLMNAPIERIAIENPISCISTEIRKPDCIVHPWHFGDEASKSTCFWLKNLPVLKHTKIVGKGTYRITKGGKKMYDWYNLPPSAERKTIRSKTFPGMAHAIAEQWGGAMSSYPVQLKLF